MHMRTYACAVCIWALAVLFFYLAVHANAWRVWASESMRNGWLSLDTTAFVCVYICGWGYYYYCARSLLSWSNYTVSSCICYCKILTRWIYIDISCYIPRAWWPSSLISIIIIVMLCVWVYYRQKKESRLIPFLAHKKKNEKAHETKIFYYKDVKLGDSIHSYFTQSFFICSFLLIAFVVGVVGVGVQWFCVQCEWRYTFLTTHDGSHANKWLLFAGVMRSSSHTHTHTKTGNGNIAILRFVRLEWPYAGGRNR